MKCKVISLVLGALLASGFSAAAYAETSEVYYAEAFEEADPAVTMSYDEETGMYVYSFDGESEFWASEMLDSSETVTAALWIATESPDVEIKITCEGEPYAYSPTTVLDTVGSYVIEVSRMPVYGEKSTITYNVEITSPDEVADNAVISNIQGRLEMQPDGDGFSYSFGAIGSIWTNVLDGETVSFPAKVLADDALYCSVIRDGAVYSLPQNGVINDDGAYSVTITAYLSDGSVETRYFSFNVYTRATNRLGIYHPPFGYTIQNVYFEGVEYPFEQSYCSFTDDGEYTVVYSNGADSREVVLTSDTTAPVLYFNGGSEIVFDEAVTVTADSPCTITVQKNGMAAGSGTVLNSTGIYRVTAVDEAGNATSARIEITAVSAINPMNIMLVFGVAIVAAIVYFIVQKNKRPVVR